MFVEDEGVLECDEWMWKSCYYYGVVDVGYDFEMGFCCDDECLGFYWFLFFDGDLECLLVWFEVNFDYCVYDVVVVGDDLMCCVIYVYCD